MTKKQVMTSVDDDVIARAKDRGFNVSEILERALQDKLGLVNLEISKSQNCENCCREMKMATTDGLNGLTWLYPDEIWVCPKCLRDISIKNMKTAQ